VRVLLTGGAGFVGQWLARALLARGDAVDLSGLGTTFSGPPVLTADERRSVRWVPADVRDADEMAAVVKQSRPELIFHLAGVSFPPDADHSPIAAYDINALGAVRLLTAVQRGKLAGEVDPTIVVVGSGMQYGLHEPSEMPLGEDAAQRPLTTYAASKTAQEVACLQLCRASGVRVVCTRSFNHSGRGHGAQYLLPSLVARARQAARSQRNALVLGNDVVRDYLHVSDVVDAYLRLASHGTVGQSYNVASGVGVSVRELAAAVLLHAGVDADISTDPSLVRSTDIPVLVGSPAKLMRETGWTPTKTHDDIIDDLLHAATD
jgi:GDP-4-dehydro-6-deoxy-D-mannose reductase